MIPVSTFADSCIDELPGIPIGQVNKLVIRAARELCRAGRLWRFVHADIEVDQDTFVYPLTGQPAGSLIHDIDVVSLNGGAIDPLSRGATRLTPDQSIWTRTGDAIAFRVPTSGTLTVQSVLIPTPDANQLPPELYNEWLEAIEHGVKWMAMVQPKVEWTNPELGQYHAGRWVVALANARSFGRGGQTTQRRRTTDGWRRRSQTMPIVPTPSNDATVEYANMYWGYSALTTLNQAQVLALGFTRQTNSKAGDYLFEGDASGRYLWFAIPDALGAAEFEFGGFELSLVISTIMMTIDGESVPYTLYRTPDVQAGEDIEITIQ